LTTTEQKIKKIDWDYSIGNPYANEIPVFSLLTNAKARVKSKDISVDEYINLVQDPKNKDTFTRLRALPIAEYKEIKADYFKAITGSCLLDKYGREKENVQALNGLFVVDFDKLPDSFNTWADFKEALTTDEYSYLLHYSASGRGLCMFVKIPTENDFLEIYNSLEKYFFEKYTAITDKLRDINRLRFISYDPDVAINQNSKIYTDLEKVVLSEVKPYVKKDTGANGQTIAEAFNSSGEQGLSLINNVLQSQGWIISNGYGKNIFNYKYAPDASPKSMVAFYNMDAVLFCVYSTNTGLKKLPKSNKSYPIYNLYDLYSELNSYSDFEASEKLAALGFGKWNEKKSIADFGFLQDDPKHIAPDYKNRYDFFVNEYIKYDTPIPEELKEEFTFLQKIVKPDKKEDRTAWLLEEIHRRKIDFTKTIAPPPQAWTLDDTTLGRFGDFGLVIGKAKSKKSFFINIAIATAISDDHIQGRFKSHLPEDRKKVVYFDTEQQNYDVDIACNRIALQLNLNGKKELNDNLLVVPLRGDSPALKIELIEAYLYNTPDLSFVVIDGIRDLITSINDEEQASMIATKLLKWSKDLNIYILVVLHVNKGDNNARGHVGTELVNKAESVLSISVDSKDPEISVMEPVHCRGKAPKSFAFRINERGLPEEVTDYAPNEKNAPSFDLATIDQSNILRAIYAPTENADGIKFSDLYKLIAAEVKKYHNVKIGENKAKDILKSAKDRGLLYQDTNLGPYKFKDIVVNNKITDEEDFF
jgi:hypothetical protein